MEFRLLNILCCPACGGELSVKAFESAGDTELVNGLISCACGEQYPVINHIPRLLIGDLKRDLAVRYGDFFNQFCPDLKLNFSGKNQDPHEVGEVKTQGSFGYEWTEFSEYSADNFSSFIRPLPQGFFKHKFGLDLGCGAGRHVKYAVSLGAEMVGVDVSQAVDVALKANLGRGAQFIQADVYQLPFRKNTFDFAYSLGVLHHLPDPEKGFESLIPFLKPGGSIFIWVYQRTLRKKVLEAIRLGTTQLSLSVLKKLSWAAALADYGVFVNLYRRLGRFGPKARWVPSRIKEYAGYNFYVSYTDWFDRLSAPVSNCYSRDDIQRWFVKNKLKNIDTALIDDSWVWGKGEKS